MVREEVEAAVKQIRREGLKAAVLHAFVESAVVFFLALATLRLTGVEAEILGYSVVYPAASAAAVTFFFADSYLVYRRRTLEYFEEINPGVREKLRTARDAAREGESSAAAEALYREVLEDLQETSSQGFVHGRRLTVSLALVLGVGAVLMAGGTGVPGPVDLGERTLWGEPVDDDFGLAEDAEDRYTGPESGDHLLGEGGEMTEGEDELLLDLRGGGAPAPGDGGGSAGEYYDASFEDFEVDAVAAVDIYKEDAAALSPEDRRVVKEYFHSVREGG